MLGRVVDSRRDCVVTHEEQEESRIAHDAYEREMATVFLG